MSATVIAFPLKHPSLSLSPIDWSVLEQARRAYHAQVPKIAIVILRCIAEAGPSSPVLRSGRWFLRAGLPCSNRPVAVPRDELADTRRLLALLERLDRFGGHLGWEGLECRLDPAVKSPELRLLQPISEDLQDRLLHSLTSSPDHQISCSRWSVLGKEVDELDLLAILIDNEGQLFLGLFDKKSGIRLFDQLRAGQSIHLQAYTSRLVPAHDG